MKVVGRSLDGEEAGRRHHAARMAISRVLWL